ncbi:uncharacterized protein LOC126320589 [Schistocerca gregaria]|uniref:uncharacterized protein LOC126320589 n=1 Tax=Schistocerca gregaria TaxID=7010 RepID=UPI00211EE082|nr:uncharacterized protein LOC126320589 [Schistocerca gregaria]
MSRDAASYRQRGQLYLKMGDYERALGDLSESSRLDHTEVQTWNQMGSCCHALGRARESVECFLKALSLDPKNEFALVNLAHVYQDWGKEQEAEACLDRVCSLNAENAQLVRLRASLYFAVGRHQSCAEVLEAERARRGGSLERRQVEMLATVYHGLGRLEEAVEEYDRALKLGGDASWVCWYQKCVCLYWQRCLDEPIASVDMDRDLPPAFKEGWCKRSPVTESMRRLVQWLERLDGRGASVEELVPSSEELELISYARDVGVWIHQDAPGFLRNRRQVAMAGFAALEVAQTLRQKWGASASVDWRSIYSIVVKWRQYSEPNDAVWWVDQLTPEQFVSGFGSQTPIVTGQYRVIRYGPMFHRTFSIMKTLIAQQCAVGEQELRALESAKTCADMYDVMKSDFWVLTSCHSVAIPGKVMEGTRLTLQRTCSSKGFEFGIRTPGTPPRWLDYQLELDHAWNQLSLEANKPSPCIESVSYWIMACTFYWYNFMPLSRGSAATGYITMLGLFLACGYRVASKIPRGTLLDWDAILFPTLEQFLSSCTPWLYPGRQAIDTSDFDSLPSVSELFPTLRKRIALLNYASPRV